MTLPAWLPTQQFIGGHWTAAVGGDTFAVVNPATGESLAAVPQGDERDADLAIAAAAAALPAWRAATAATRAQCLDRWQQLMLDHLEPLAVLMTCEQGKPLAEARAEIRYGAAFIRWFSEEARRVYGTVIPSPWADKRLLTLKMPLGVCAAITPWNFPSAMLARKAGAALAAGCTLVAKPAEQTPLSALALAVLAQQAGIPPGVLNVVTGDPIAIGGALTSHPLVRKVSFTGSTAVGRLLMAQCAPTLKKLSLELGGNAPFIVLDDADLDAAVDAALFSKFRNSGQTCICTNRVLVHDRLYDAFADRFAAKAAQLVVGNGLDPRVEQGPLIDQDAVEKVTALVHNAVAGGATALVGGNRHALGGQFFSPTVLVDVTAHMAIARTETFGPVAPLLRFHDDAEALALANATEYGLAAYVFGQSLSRLWRVAEGLEYGMVAVNSGVLSTEVAPFGGVKQSGMGREGSFMGIEDYLETKYLCLGL